MLTCHGKRASTGSPAQGDASLHDALWLDLLDPTADERRRQNVPEVLTTLDEVCDAVMELITNEQLAGRVMVWWNGQPRRLIAADDVGYQSLE